MLADEEDAGDTRQSLPMYSFPVGAQYPMAYGTEQQSPTDGQQQPSVGQFAQYGFGEMYNMSQQARVVPLSMPELPQAYTPAQQGAPMLTIPSQDIPVSFGPTEIYPTTANPYAVDPAQATAFNIYDQQHQHQQQQQQQQQQQMTSSGQSLEAVQTQLRQIFTLVRDNSVCDAGAKLLETSRYLLGNVEPFGKSRNGIYSIQNVGLTVLTTLSA